MSRPIPKTVKRASLPVKAAATKMVAKKPKATPVVPNLSNATPEFLADELGEIRAKMKKLKGQEAITKEALTVRMKKLKISEAKGEVYTAALSIKERTSLDTKAVKVEMGDEWYAERCKTISYPELRTSDYNGGGEEDDE